MTYILSVLLTSLQMLACSIFFDVFFVRKYLRRKHYALLIIWAVVSILMANIMQNNIGVSLFAIEIAIYYFMNLTLYVGNWDRRLFVTVTHYATIFSITYLTQILCAAAMNMTRGELINNQRYYTLVMTLNIGECFLFPLLLQPIHKKPVVSQKARPWIPLALFFPICTLFTLFMAQMAQGDIAWTVSLFILCVTDISALLLLDQIENTSQLRETLAVSRQRMNIEQANMKALSDSYTAQRKMIHDFRKYLTTLAGMLEQGNITQAVQYLEDLKLSQTERILLVNTHNPLIDAILNQEGYAAQDKHIDIRFVLNNLSEMAIPSLDLTIVIGNLLDNAIEGCERLESGQQRNILVKAIYDDDKERKSLFFSVVNTSPPVTIRDEKVITTKSPPELHGYGLPNVLSVLKKYNVEYVMSYKNGKFLFALEWPVDDSSPSNENSNGAEKQEVK